MNASEIDAIMSAVRAAGLQRAPWLAMLRYPTDAEVQCAERACAYVAEHCPTRDEIIERTPTRVLKVSEQ